MVNYFERHDRCVVLISDGYLSDENLENIGELFETYNASASAIRNFVRVLI